MLALLEDNIESAIDYIQSSLSKDKSYFLGPEFAIYSFYEPLVFYLLLHLSMNSRKSVVDLSMTQGSPNESKARASP
jgi:hypothetical protein